VRALTGGPRRQLGAELAGLEQGLAQEALGAAATPAEAAAALLHGERPPAAWPHDAAQRRFLEQLVRSGGWGPGA
jgi:hypothetical protein